MQVLKHGNTYEELECQLCKAQIGYTQRDIEHSVMHDAYNGNTHETITEYLYCPECGCRIVLTLKIDGVEREIRKNHI